VLLQGRAAAEHHGSGGSHAELVRGAVHVDPFVDGALQAADALPHGVVQDLRPAAGNGVETRVLSSWTAVLGWLVWSLRRRE